MSDESEFEKELEKYIAELKASVSAKEKEKLRERWRKSYAKNPERALVATRKWVERNPDYYKKYREENREKEKGEKRCTG